MRLDFGRDLVTRSGRYLVAGSQVPGGGLGRRRERAKEGGGEFPRDGRPQITTKLGRQAAGLQDSRVQSAECRAQSTAGSWVRVSQRTEAKATIRC